MDAGMWQHYPCVHCAQHVTSIRNSKAHFTSWTGEKTKGVLSGIVLVYARNSHRNEMTQVRNIRHEDRQPLSASARWKRKRGFLHLVHQMWYPKRIWLDRGTERLEFKKKGDHYWLEAAEVSVGDKGAAIPSINADASPLMRWHERLRHLNLSTKKTYGW